MPEPILTLDDLEPERPTVAINRSIPDGPWQAFKERHFDVLLRWVPVRYTRVRQLFPLRTASEFGLAGLRRLEALQQEVRSLAGQDDPAAVGRVVTILREIAGMVLDAPADVLDSLNPRQHSQILLTFPRAAMGLTPTPHAPENPSTSAASSPASAVSTAPTTG